MSLCLLYASFESCEDIVNLIPFLVGLKLMVIEGVNVDVWLVGYTRFYLKVLGFFFVAQR